MKVLLAILAGAAAAAPNQQFNLVCSGTEETRSLVSGNRTEPYSVTYRVDLKANRWCDGECKATHAIAEVQPTMLRLEVPKDIDGPSGREYFNGSIDRETGRHSMLSASRDRFNILTIKWEGNCSRAAFTGFPEFATKF